MGNEGKRRVVTMALLLAMFSSCIGGALAKAPDSQAAKKAKLSTKKVSLEIGKKKTIKITGKKKKAVYTFKASNKKIKVTKKGVIRAVRAGTAKVTVKERYKKKTKKIGTVKVTVKKPNNPVPSEVPSVSPQVTVPPASGNPQVTPPASTVPGGTQTQAPPAGSETPKPSESGDPGEFTPVVYKNAEFETGTDGFVGRSGSEKITLSDGGHSGKCIYVTNRKDAWHGAMIDVSDSIVQGATYTVSAYLKHTEDGPINIKCSGLAGQSYPQIALVENVAPGEWVRLEGEITIPAGFSSIYFELPGSKTASFYLDSVVITQITPGKEPVEVKESIYETYKDIFPYMGTCANYYGYGEKTNQLIDEDKVAFIKKQFNSITLENEMKPDAVLGSSATKLTVSEAKGSNYDYVIPENYAEENVPKLNFDTIDKTLEFCKNEGMKMRAHTLMWHQQTPSWFFAKNYSGSTKTDAATMDARLEFYVRTVMKHVIEKEIELTGEAGSLVYAWDVTNEYLHRSNGPTSLSWVSVYGDLGLEPTYVKKAFRLAYDVLESYGIQDKVTLFYNDYDTYFVSDDLVELVTYINSGETNKQGQKVNICGGIGMQSHVDADRPTLAEYGAALDKFLATGLEVQITELDMTINFGESSNGGWGYLDKGQDNDYQAAFAKDFMELVITKQKNIDKTKQKGITGLTIWGLYDGCSWRGECAPLLFGGSIKDPKPSFYSFIEAANIWNNN